MSKAKSYQAVTINPDGTAEVITVEGDTLRQLQDIVGGYIEGVYGWTEDPETHPFDVTLFVNEEGKLKDLPVNSKATALWWALNEDAVGVDCLRGAVVVTGGVDKYGNNLPVLGAVVDLLGLAGD